MQHALTSLSFLKQRETSRTEGNEMSLSFTATGQSKFTPGPYPGHLVKLEKKFKITENEIAEREERPYLRWIFAVDHDGLQHQSLSVLSSTSFGMGPSGPSKGRRFAEAILGRELKIGENFTPEDLYDRRCVLHVDLEKTGRGVFPRIVDVTPFSQESEDHGEEGDEGEADEASLDDLPF
jgi:hypothetical protein